MKNVLLIKLISYIALMHSLSVYALDETEQASEQMDTNTEEAANKAAPSRAMPNSHANKQREISNLLTGTSTQVVKLNALEQDFEMYFLTALEKEPVGSVLFFPDERNHSDWPVTLNPLRTGLSLENWQTAVLTVPTTKEKKIPQRSVYTVSADTNTESDTSNSDSQEETNASQSTTDSPTDTSDTPDKDDTQSVQTTEGDTAEQMPPEKTMAEVTMARALATHDYLKQSAEGMIIIGIGQGATWASAYASTLAESDIEMSRLILINPQQSMDVSAPEFTPLIVDIKIDTFDIYTPLAKNATKGKNSPLGRKRAANLSDIESYRQIKAPASAWKKSGNDWLYRKIKGVIKNNITQSFKDKNSKEKMPTPPEKTNQKPGSTNTT